MLGDNRFGLDKHQRRAPTAPDAATTQPRERTPPAVRALAFKWIFVSYFGAGKTELLMMKTNILPRLPAVVLLWLSSMSPLPGKGL